MVELEEHERRLLVLYASQTGTAEEVAERIAREGKRRHFKTRVMAMDAYEITNLINEPLVVFVCATTGQGDNPDNMTKTWRFLARKSLPPDSLANMRCTVFGLGDSSYAKYNFTAKRLHKRLQQLGAQLVYRRGLGDEQHELGIDGELDPWLDGMWLTLLQLYPLPSGKEIIRSDVKPEPRFNPAIMMALGGEPVPEFRGVDAFAPGTEAACYSRDQPISVRLKTNRRLTAEDHWQDVRHFELETNGKLIYGPGDVLYVRPRNMPDDVAAFLEYFNLDPDTTFVITSKDPDAQFPPLPSPCTVRELATSYLDIRGRPRRFFFELLSFFATNDMETERLREFCMPENMDELYDYCYRMRRTMLEVLSDFPSCRGNVPLAYLLDLFPLMQPRAFSIASSPKMHPGEVHVCAAIVQYRTRMATPRTGTCTRWLASLQPGARVDVWVSAGTLKMPKDDAVPMIMVGPGTGIAPFRNLMEERVSQGLAAGTLVVGCRNRNKDYFYQSEWEKYEAEGKLALITAFSRDQENKIYVQHRIKERGSDLWPLIHEQGAHIYVCGNSKRMPDDVREALQEVAEKAGGLSGEDAKKYLLHLEAAGRLQMETWS
eukprot:comp14899_c1_seq1/m.11448 comp14899_c1_seq1/g.11448  ORF comp14899_c1_seq1/g.11448 comp14899_c1_seq1/m.11448 type:complete len:602 (-) comp14899_c1_seq1:75-1880(-)